MYINFDHLIAPQDRTGHQKINLDILSILTVDPLLDPARQFAQNNRRLARSPEHAVSAVCSGGCVAWASTPVAPGVDTWVGV